MTPRRRALIIVGLVLILIVIVVLAILLLRNAVAPAPPAETPTEQETVETPPVVEPEEFENPLAVPGAAPVPTGSRQMAELFAERYGSYSNQGDYQNLRDLLPVMTARYRRETEAFLAEADRTPGQTYVGVTSVKVSTDVRSADDDAAVIAVSLQQRKSSGSADPTVGYRTLRMELVRVGDDWRIDAAAWEN